MFILVFNDLLMFFLEYYMYYCFLLLFIYCLIIGDLIWLLFYVLLFLFDIINFLCFSLDCFFQLDDFIDGVFCFVKVFEGLIVEVLLLLGFLFFCSFVCDLLLFGF